MCCQKEHHRLQIKKKRQEIQSFVPLKSINFRTDSSKIEQYLSIEDSIRSIYNDYDLTKDNKQLQNNLRKLKEEKNQLKFWGYYETRFLQPESITEDFFLQQTTSFKKRNILQNIQKEIYQPTRNLFNYSILSILICFVIWFGWIAGNTALPQSFRNSFGLFVLIYPFLLSGIGIVAPSFLPALLERTTSQFNQRSSKLGALSQEERVLYHEAGHFLVAYLLGIPITGYQLTGNIGISLATEISINIQETRQNDSNMNISQIKSKDIGRLLIISFAGIITERLLYESIKGGIEDYSLAIRLMRKWAAENRSEQNTLNVGELEGLLRWALLQAEVLISRYYSQLDLIVTCLKDKKGVAEIMIELEQSIINDIVELSS